MQYFEIKAVFDERFNGKPNFMTPHIITYGKRGKLVYELSHGTGLCDAPIWGVTVIELPSENRKDLSKCFSSPEEAKAYIANDFIDP